MSNEPQQHRNGIFFNRSHNSEAKPLIQENEEYTIFFSADTIDVNIFLYMLLYLKAHFILLMLLIMVLDIATRGENMFLLRFLH